jgi:group II intron reverse transcriptase/maturase
MGFSYGFRPGRSQHDALDALSTGIYRKQVNWVLDADIQKFFDAMNHDWLLRFLQHRIGDKRLLRLIAKWLTIGVMKGSHREASVQGAPQGAVVSPILANIYLHYVFDLWSHRWRRQKAQGDMMIIRYADDTVLGFEYEQEAKHFLQDMQERLQAFGLTLHPDKTQLIRFGRHAINDRKWLGEGKPETFDFLGFTHFCTQSRKNGAFVIGRQTIKKRMRATLHAIKSELRKRWHDPLPKTGEWIQKVLQGHMNYFAVSGNDPSIWLFFNEVRRLWLHRIRNVARRVL